MRLSVVRLSQKLLLQFVPKHSPTSIEEVKMVQEFIDQSSKMFIITGAGISTESGIPDYRSESVGLYARSKHRPMKIQEFLSSIESRKRYWARNYIAWPKFSSSKPNISHEILSDWEKSGKIHCLVTQNVDGLHGKAGSSAVELHGSGFSVKCLNCDYTVARDVFQGVLKNLNMNMDVNSELTGVRPDGDVQLAEADVTNFVVPDCPSCSGILQPNIVFFGDNVKREKVEFLYSQLSNCDSILVLGSSLQVFSSFRFVLRGYETKIPIATLTIGPTRADKIAQLIVNARLGDILPQIRI